MTAVLESNNKENLQKVLDFAAQMGVTVNLQKKKIAPKAKNFVKKQKLSFDDIFEIPKIDFSKSPKTEISEEDKKTLEELYGVFHSKASPELAVREKDAWGLAVMEKHKKCL